MQEYESSKKNNHRYEKHDSVESNNSIQSGDSGYSKQSSNQSNSLRSSNNSTRFSGSIDTSIGKINLGTGEGGIRTIDQNSLMEAFVKHHNKRLEDLLEGASTSNNDTKKPKSHTNEQNEHRNRQQSNQSNQSNQRDPGRIK